MRVALLGASSATARRVARDLREQAEVSEVIELDKGGHSIPQCELLAGSTGELAVDLESAQTAIERRIPYLSSATDGGSIAALMALDEHARAAGGHVVAGLGWTYGLSWALVNAAGTGVPEPAEVRISTTVSAAGVHGATALEGLAKDLSAVAGVFEGGGWRRAQAAGTQQHIYFPEPLGWRDVWLSSGAEVDLLPRAMPTLRKVMVLAGVSEGTAARILKATRRFGGRATPSLIRLASRSASGGPPGGSWSAIRVDVSGREGPPVAYSILDQLPNLVAAPLVAAVTLFARRHIPEPGSVLPGAVFSYSSFFTMLAERGVRVARLAR